MRIASLLLFFLFIQLTSSTVVLKPFSISFPDLPAKSALGVSSSGICGALHVANPPNACSPLLNPRGPNGTGEIIKFGLIVRGDCSFEDKIRNAQDWGFGAAIVYDNKVNMLIDPEGIKVHAVFVSKAAGEVLTSHALGDPGECCIYPLSVDRGWTVLAISLISLAVVLAFLVVAFVTPRHWLTNWHGRTGFYQRNVDTRMMDALPGFTFRSSSDSSRCSRGETCAICLEDYKDGELLRLLPCQHEFHSSCVDLWLIKWGTFCPICKLDLTTNASNSEVKRGLRHVNC